jgi:hypothetical protein
MSEDQEDTQVQPARAAGARADDLIAAAATHNFTISRRQLAEWHRAGLLPTPEQTYGDKAGSTSVYPTGTALRLLALCECRRRHPRSLDDIAWCLWWAGFDVPEGTIRRLLERGATMWRDQTGQLRHLLAQSESGADAGAGSDVDEELTNALETFLYRMSIERSPRKALAQLRKRVGRERFPTVVRVMAEVVTGTFEGYRVDPVTGTSDDEREIVETALDLTRARTDRLVGAGPWLTTDSGETLAKLSRLLRQSPPGQGIEATSAQELAHVRDEAKLFNSLFAGLGDTLEQMFGRGAFGLTALGGLLRDQRPLEQAIWVLLWRMLRSADIGATIDMLLPLARQWQERELPAIAALEQLRTEVPATAELLHPKQIGRGLRSAREQQRREKALRQMREANAPELDAFFERHPEIPQPSPEGSDKKMTGE